ncbi:hypothetical protein [Virgibacillus ainsalahensis]
MKKMVTTLALGVLLVAGFTFAQNKEVQDLSHELEPSILSVERPSLFY